MFILNQPKDLVILKDNIDINVEHWLTIVEKTNTDKCLQQYKHLYTDKIITILTNTTTTTTTKKHKNKNKNISA